MCVKRWLAFVISVFCMTLTAGAQQSLPQDLNGTWEIKVINEIADWGGAPEHELFSVTLSFTYIDGVVDPTEPNLFVDVPDSDDDLIGFAHDDMFVLYKENIDNCGGPAVNFGREVIIGEMNKKGTRFKADGMGFDSNPECGGPWSYHLIAKKISD